jgi:hypothetical protein
MSHAEAAARLGPGVIWLQDSGAIVGPGLRLWGSAWNNRSAAWGADEATRATKWALIPPDTHILVTHNPPAGTMDLVFCKRKTVPDAACGRASCVFAAQSDHGQYEHWGCNALAARIRELGIPLHLFGHAHYETGIQTDLHRMPVVVGSCSASDVVQGLGDGSTRADDMQLSEIPLKRTTYSNAAMALTDRMAHVFDMLWQ